MLAESCVAVAKHRHGCCVLQRAIDAATLDQSQMLVAEVCTHALDLMQVCSSSPLSPPMLSEMSQNSYTASVGTESVMACSSCK